MARSFVGGSARAGGSNAEVKGVHRFLLQPAGALAEFGDGDPLHDFHHGFAHFLHDAADGATRFVRAGTLFVKSFADTTHRCQGALQVPHRRRKRDFLRRAGQPVAAGDPALRICSRNRLGMFCWSEMVWMRTTGRS